MEHIFLASNGSDPEPMPPPKPPRIEPQRGNPSESNQPTTYIVAQNPELLTQLLRENEARGVNAAAYTTPASAFNTLAVDFANCGSNNSSPKRKVKTNRLICESDVGGGINQNMYSSHSMDRRPKDRMAGPFYNSIPNNYSTLSSLGTMSNSSSSDIFNMSSSTPSGSKPTSNYGTLDKVTNFF